MRKHAALMALTFLAGCARPISPPQIPQLAIIDINSEEFQEELAAEQTAALREVSKFRTNVTRRFYVGWEMHHGYFLIPLDDPDDWVSPDFLNNRVIAQFDGFDRQIGKKIVCECAGVAWSFHSQKRFLIRVAKLQAI